MDKDYLPGDSTSYKEYTGEYYYDDYTSSSDLYDYLILTTANIDTGITLQESRILNGTLQRTTNRLNRQRRP